MIELLIEYEFVKELGEGVGRVYQDIAENGLQEPEYRFRNATGSGRKQAVEQGNQYGTHNRNTSASHQLYHG